MTRAPSVALLCGLLGTMLVLPACGAGGAKEAVSPTALAAPETIEDAQAEIARAGAEIGLPARGTQAGPQQKKSADARASAPAPGESPPYPAAPAAAPMSPPMPAPPEATTAGGVRAEAAQPPGSTEESTARRCANLCRALASMRRAQVALCRLAGATDGRCADGKQSVAEAERLCAGCGC